MDTPYAYLNDLNWSNEISVPDVITRTLTWKNERVTEIGETPPPEYSKSKGGYKLRLIDGKLVEDTRYLRFLCRKITGDNRDKTLQFLEKQFDVESIKILMDTTYKNDKSFVKKAEESIKRLTLTRKR